MFVDELAFLELKTSDILIRTWDDFFWTCCFMILQFGAWHLDTTEAAGRRYVGTTRFMCFDFAPNHLFFFPVSTNKKKKKEGM